jgi:hypothetical protein
MNRTPIARVKDKRKVKKQMMKILGDKCTKCNNNNYYHLQFDHINDDGYKEKVNENGNIRRKRRDIYHIRAIYNKNKKLFFETYQLLCANCNQEKEIKRRENLTNE